MNSETPMTPDSSLAALALRGDAYARVLDRHRLDFCCRGQRTIGDACLSAGLDVHLVLQEIASELETRAAVARSTDWQRRSLEAVVGHLVDTHHAYTREALGRIRALLAKVVGKHGPTHPELDSVARDFGLLASDVEPHLLREERVLFPYILALGTAPAAAPFGTVANPIRLLSAEHESMGLLLERLRVTTNGFTAPPDACASYRALYAALADLRNDLMVHVALESEVLFPRARQLEARCDRADDQAANQTHPKRA